AAGPGLGGWAPYALACVPVLGAVLSVSGLMGLTAYGLLAALAAVGGLAAACGAGELLFLRPECGGVAQGLSLVWWALAGGLSVAVWLVGHRAGIRPTVRLAGAIVLTATLPVALAVLAPADTNPGPDARKTHAGRTPNVLLITADALRADYCSTYGGQVPTPHLDALAKRGVLFRHCVAVAPWTTPSLNGLMTSRYAPALKSEIERQSDPDALDYRDLAGYWCDRAGRSFADRLGDAAIETAVFAGNWRISLEFWLIKAFHHHLRLWPQHAERRGPLRRLPLLHGTVAARLPGLAPTRQLDTTRVLTDHTVAFLRRHADAADAPFFLWVHFFDPHGPFDPPARYRTQEGPWPVFPPEGGDAPNLLTMPEAERAYVRSLYEGEIRYVDDALGRILDEAEALGLDENTVVWFSSDHGEELWDRSWWGHGHTLHEELLHVPLVVAGPGIEAGEVGRPVSHVDVVPTIAELMHVEPSARWHGSSLAGLLEHPGDDGGGAPCFAQANDYFPAAEPAQSVVSGGHKLIRWRNTGRAELYDLEADPREEHDIAGHNGRLVDSLTAFLDEWAASFPSTYEAFHADAGAAVELTEEEIEGLKALGYAR
ncbi:MAG: sulfatase, partial [Candidatus Hydrogenedentes bacterium]|nr:sulfatase [Candidatus Hydrogenedentota bacterium]